MLGGHSSGPDNGRGKDPGQAWDCAPRDEGVGLGINGPGGSRRFGVRPDLQPSHHEAQECLPTGEAKIAGESPDIVEDRLASRQRGADEPVMLVGQLQDRVEEEGPKSVCFQMETAVPILNAKIPTVAGRK